MPHQGHLPPKGSKIALGMSGGVDSSLCAHLLVEQGYEVTGVFLECWRAPGCRSEEDRADALKVALSLGIPFRVLDFKEAYRQKVVESFFSEYEAGRTPNPDVLCNKEIKFGLFYDWAMAEGFAAVATGHYARISQVDQELHLAVPADTHKDQTYFLYLLRQEQLSHIVFPLQDLTKPQVRTEAKKRSIHVSDKKDSVGICFIGDINVHGFLKDRLGENPGSVINTTGQVIGSHKGLWFYTIGQRHGFELLPSITETMPNGEQISKHLIPPFYVIEKRAKTNELVVGFGSQAERVAFHIEAEHWIGKPPHSNQVQVRIRHTGKLLPATYDQTTHTIFLEEPTKGVAAGQSAVCYQNVGDTLICLGGGVISEKFGS